MKIISDFIDYYDSVAKRFYHIPNQKIWIRKTSEITDKELLKRVVESLAISDKDFRYYNWNKGDSRFTLHTGYLGVAGTAYPFLQQVKRSLLGQEEVTVFSLEEALVLSDFMDRFWKNQIYQLFSRTKQLQDNSIWHELQTPIFLLKQNAFYFSQKKSIIFIVNPNLSELNFYKVKDPFTLYQELDQFFTGLTIPTETYPQLSDMYRLIEHGFDKKLSFRKQKEQG